MCGCGTGGCGPVLNTGVVLGQWLDLGTFSNLNSVILAKDLIKQQPANSGQETPGPEHSQKTPSAQAGQSGAPGISLPTESPTGLGGKGP